MLAFSFLLLILFISIRDISLSTKSLKRGEFNNSFASIERLAFGFSSNSNKYIKSYGFLIIYIKKNWKGK